MGSKVVEREYDQEYLFEDIFPDPLAVFAGVKAVYSGLKHRYLCFGKSGATSAAEKAGKTPWAICIGANKVRDPEDKGRVLHLVQMTSSHQSTPKFAANEGERQFYARWPDAVAVRDVFEVIGHPHFFTDLKMSVHPLTQAHDKIVEFTPDLLPILEALKGYKLRLVDLPPLPSSILLGNFIPTTLTAEEGAARMKNVRAYERSSKLAKSIKAANLKANGGVCVCEGCGFSTENTTLLDVHHRRPVQLGVYTCTPHLLTILCPTCHRVVHHCVPMQHEPMELPELKAWHSKRTALLADLTAKAAVE